MLFEKYNESLNDPLKLGITTPDFPDESQINYLKGKTWPSDWSKYNSDQICIINNYCGWIIDNYHGLVQDQFKGQKIVIYTVFLEYPHIKSRLEYFSDKNTFVICVVSEYLNQIQIQELEKQYACKIFCIPSVHSQFNKIFKKFNLSTSDKIFKKLFLSLNRISRPHRHALIQFIYKCNLQDKFLFSYHGLNYFHDGLRKLNKIDFDQINDVVGKSWFNSNLNLQDIYNRLPIQTNVDDTWNFSIENKNDLDFYTNTFCSVVTESHFFNHTVKFTEKIWKPIAVGHPFLLFNGPNSLKLLKDMGFKTFDKIFDESYDTIEDHQLRQETIFLEILRICSKSEYEIQKMYKEIKPVILHNYNHFWQEFSNVNRQDFALVKQEINEILKEKTNVKII